MSEAVGGDPPPPAEAAPMAEENGVALNGDPEVRCGVNDSHGSPSEAEEGEEQPTGMDKNSQED